MIESKTMQPGFSEYEKVDENPEQLRGEQATYTE